MAKFNNAATSVTKMFIFINNIFKINKPICRLKDIVKNKH